MLAARGRGAAIAEVSGAGGLKTRAIFGGSALSVPLVDLELIDETRRVGDGGRSRRSVTGVADTTTDGAAAGGDADALTTRDASMPRDKDAAALADDDAGTSSGVGPRGA